MKFKLLILSLFFFGIATAQNKPKGAPKDSIAQLDEIVVSASRTPERIKESPVTIERFTAKDIKKTASASFYDGLENLKEVQMNTSSMSFKSINTRGFASVSNTRFMQLVDGMDNSSPLLNFVLGNMIGISEIDVKSVELLPGASSALYGANAFNGILFMTSQSPFENQGVRAYVKYGQTTQKAAGTNDYYDFGIRMAKAFTPKFAAKANMTFMRGTDWSATNYEDLSAPGRTRAHQNYNGLNVYGDEVSTNIRNVSNGMLAAGAITPAQYTVFQAILPNENVSRTGYNENELTDNAAKNTKVDVSLHYKPFANDVEVIWQSKFGFGNAVYQGANRYYLNNFFMQQHKLEVKGKNFFVRGYTTTEDGGNSYDMRFAAINTNRAWKSDAVWFGTYAGAFVTTTLPPFSFTATQAHAFARTQADAGRLMPGTAAFKTAFDKVNADANVLTGAKLVDNSRIYHSDANYNFKDIIKFAEVQVGGSYRQFELNSHGRIYTDATSPITYNEYGAYTQVQKKTMDDVLKITASVRYDKAKNFDGSFSPRVSLVVSPTKNHSFRASFQTGFRNPTTQDQYIGFNVGSAMLLGSAADNLTRYSETLPVSTATGQFLAGGTTKTLTGNDAYYNSYEATSVQAFAAAAPSVGVAAAAQLLTKANVNLVKPETVKALDLGYRGSFAGFNFDVNGYYNIYNDFIGNLNVIAPYYGTAVSKPAATDITLHAIANGNTRVFQLYTNTSIEIKSLGAGFGVSRKLTDKFELSANYNYAEFDFDQSLDPGFEAGFNTPKHKAKVALSGDKVLGNLGFNVSGRWNDEYLWQSSFADGIIEESTVVDAQINYSLPSFKSTFKIGAMNIGGQEYNQVYGAGLIGQQWFASWTINP